MYKIGVIGDKNSIQGLLALGLDIFPCEDPSEGAEVVKKCVTSNYAILYVTEQLVAALGEEIEKYNDLQLPALIPIPGTAGSLGIGKNNVKKFVERAVGSDILSNE